MKLYDLKTGTNTRRVRIFLAEKGLTIPSVEVDMLNGENLSAEYLAKNPLGAMPVLELDDGTHISESIAICRYLEELHPEPNLFGATPVERALVEMWNRRIELEILRPITESFAHLSPFWIGRREQRAEVGQFAREYVAKRMEWLNAELSNRNFVVGDRYTVADITAQCAFVLGRNTGVPIPPELAHLTRWYQAVTKRPTARA